MDAEEMVDKMDMWDMDLRTGDCEESWRSLLDRELRRRCQIPLGAVAGAGLADSPGRD